MSSSSVGSRSAIDPIETMATSPAPTAFVVVSRDKYADLWDPSFNRLQPEGLGCTLEGCGCPGVGAFLYLRLFLLRSYAFRALKKP